MMLIPVIILTCDCPCQIYDQQGVDQDEGVDSMGCLDQGQLANLEGDSCPSIWSTAHTAELSTILCEQFNEI